MRSAHSTKVAPLPSRTCQGRKAQGMREGGGNSWHLCVFIFGMERCCVKPVEPSILGQQVHSFPDRGTESRSEDDPPTAEVWGQVTRWRRKLPPPIKKGLRGWLFVSFVATCCYLYLQHHPIPQKDSEYLFFFEKVVVQLSIGNDANWILVPPWTGRSAGRDEKRHKGGRFSVPETGRLGLKPKGCETAWRSWRIWSDGPEFVRVHQWCWENHLND